MKRIMNPLIKTGHFDCDPVKRLGEKLEAR